MKEVGRRCERCGYGWFATEPKHMPHKPRWFDETGAFWTSGQARMARRVSNYERAVADRQTWGRCPNCGSQRIATDRNRRFVPTGAKAPAAPAPHSGSQRGGRTPAGDSRRGTSAWSKLAAFHRQHWRIIWAVVFLVAPIGSIGDGETYTGPFWLDALKFIGYFIVCWAIGGFFLRLHFAHRSRLAEEADD